MKHDKLLSVILLSYYSCDRINIAYNKLKELLAKERIPFEFIIVDDGSEDQSFQIAKELEAKASNVYAYQLSRNYTSNYAWFAGLSVRKGACASYSRRRTATLSNDSGNVSSLGAGASGYYSQPYCS